MLRRLFVLLMIAALLAGCASPADPAPIATVRTLKIVASTSWVAAFALAAGATDITVIAPATIQHPPDYDPKPSDLAAISKADYVLMAGFEGFAKRMQEALGGDSAKLVTVKTENSPEVIHAEVTRLGELFGTQAAASAFLTKFDAEYARLSVEVKTKIGGRKPVVVAQVFVAPWAAFAGLDVAGSYGPMPMTPDQLKTLAGLKPELIFDNAHTGGGQPLLEASGAAIIKLVNFPDEKLDLLAVFRENAARIEAAFAGQ